MEFVKMELLNRAGRIFYLRNKLQTVQRTKKALEPVTWFKNLTADDRRKIRSLHNTPDVSFDELVFEHDWNNDTAVVRGTRGVYPQDTEVVEFHIKVEQLLDDFDSYVQVLGAQIAAEETAIAKLEQAIKQLNSVEE